MATEGQWWRRTGHKLSVTEDAVSVIGTRIREAREAQSLKTVELARATGRDPSGLSDIERGHTTVSLGGLLQLADVLRVSPGSLLPQDDMGGEYARGFRHGYLAAIERLQQEIPGS